MSSPKIEERLKEKQIKSVNGLKENPRIVSLTEDECRKLCDDIKLKFIPGYEKRVIERITTTETPDRDGDIVRAKGIDNKNYRLNPVVMFAHNKSDFPVGRSVKEWIDKSITGWRSWDLYLDNTVDTTGRSDLVFRMVDAGAMTGGSIGFIPKANGAKYDHTDEERKNLGLGKYGVEFISVEKIEHSACSIPANAEVLAAALKSCNIEQIRKQLVKSDLDIMEKQKMIDDNLIDVFYSVLQIPKNISVPICETCMEKVDIEYVQKPYPNEHACRLNEPGKYNEFRRGTRKHNGKTYSVIYGKLKDRDSWEDQAYRYPKDKWTESEARSHCKDHKGILFEPASEKEIKQEEEMIINIDLNKAIEGIASLTKQMETFNENMKNIEKSTTEKFKSLMEIADKSIASIKQIETGKTVFDKKDIENILRIN